MTPSDACGPSGPAPRPSALQANGRLLDLSAAAFYLGLSEWTIRDLEWSGVLRRVRIPTAQGGEVRRILFDREDLDRLIEQWKAK